MEAEWTHPYGYSRDHLGFHTVTMNDAKKIFNKSSELVTCSPDPDLDPRTNLNGPFVSMRKVQKFLDLGRRETLNKRRKQLRELIDADRKKWQCELSKEGLTLYTFYSRGCNMLKEAPKRC